MVTKSITFSREARDIEGIQTDVKEVKSLSAQQRRKLCEFLSTGSNLITKDQSLGDKLHGFLRESQIPGPAYQCARRILSFFIQCHDLRGDSPDVILDDLAELVPLGAPGAKEDFSTLDFFKAMLPAVKRGCEYLLRDNAVHRGLPFLEGMSYSCDVRMVVARQFRGLEDRLQDYKPVPVAWVPVGVMSLKTDEEGRFHFQIDLHRLEVLLEVMGAMKKDLLAARDHLAAAGIAAEHLTEAEAGEAAHND